MLQDCRRCLCQPGLHGQGHRDVQEDLDLTVTNTVGDLYSRLGETDKATVCFKTVGDAYASQGFTVKAIAMYKKICKLQPSLESLLKLAELYSQQGLFNDARAQ